MPPTPLLPCARMVVIPRRTSRAHAEKKAVFKVILLTGMPRRNATKRQDDSGSLPTNLQSPCEHYVSTRCELAPCWCDLRSHPVPEGGYGLASANVQIDPPVGTLSAAYRLASPPPSPDAIVTYWRPLCV